MEKGRVGDECCPELLRTGSYEEVALDAQQGRQCPPPSTPVRREMVLWGLTGAGPAGHTA